MTVTKRSESLFGNGKYNLYTNDGFYNSEGVMTKINSAEASVNDGVQLGTQTYQITPLNGYSYCLSTIKVYSPLLDTTNSYNIRFNVV